MLISSDPMKAELRQRYGAEVFREDGSLDRKALGAIVFEDEQALNDLLNKLAQQGRWDCVGRYVHLAGAQCIDALMVLAVDQGNFEAVDLLDEYL